MLATNTDSNEKDFSHLEKQLDVAFKDKDLLEQAFTHRSYINENRNNDHSHNERLEFLGDAVLELAVTRYLYDRYPETPEGELTSWRAALVNAKMLSEIAKEINFGDYMLLSRGEEKETGKARDYILANTMEAFLGALYLDQGYEICNDFILRHILSKLDHVLENRLFEDAKSRFQEIAQEKTGITPNYTVTKEWGPDHEKTFRIGVYLGDQLIEEGEGLSKQEAEQEAARNAMAKKQWQ